MDRPFQLTLGGRRGLRGFNREDFPGARRIVINLEDRIYLGWPAPSFADLGITLFADVGRMFAGDVPFGFDSGWRGSVGGGLRIGFPAGSRANARIDLAWPIGAQGSAGGPILRISLADLLGLRQGLADPQLTRSRLLRIGPDRFNPRR
jgi:hemolysin activation/secretion protein